MRNLKLSSVITLDCFVNVALVFVFDWDLLLYHPKSIVDASHIVKGYKLLSNLRFSSLLLFVVLLIDLIGILQRNLLKLFRLAFPK